MSLYLLEQRQRNFVWYQVIYTPNFISFHIGKCLKDNVKNFQGSILKSMVLEISVAEFAKNEVQNAEL
jgi:hypothetical protein